ncbi:MAG TPA: uracil-DNA glycosylase [Candidimonas sp.]|nr:uracil-DNA glycosylase [Candidimonas sp.]
MNAPVISALQRAWLQEIGIDKQNLARYAAAPALGSGSGLRRARPTMPDAAPDAAAQRAPQSTPPVGPAVTPQRAPRIDKDRPAATPPTPMPVDWPGLQLHVAACQACDLHAGRSQTVFGTGETLAPKWMVVGEAPGGSDDKAGMPFQGRPGALLQAMLTSIGVLPASSVFYTNLIKCRPLGNRTPTADEIAACAPYLWRQLALLKPEGILALGKLAAQALLKCDDDLDVLRGRVHRVSVDAEHQIPLVVTYHPASLLLRPQHKADAWHDLNLALSINTNQAGAKPQGY